jgi:glycosyltransferase involved in cell wall biosynthesis
LATAIIIPAYNEGSRLGGVLDALQDLPADWERLVVDDGSQDDTATVARTRPDVHVLELPRNLGKGAAMWEGAIRSQADALIFIDADLRGLTAAHVEALAAPVLAGDAEMSIGLFRTGRKATDFSHVIAPWVSGQRCIRREVFLGIPELKDSRQGVELVLTRAARSQGWRVTEVPWAGVTHAMKEEKLGPIRGFAARCRMYGEIAAAHFAGRSRFTKPAEFRKPERRRS